MGRGLCICFVLAVAVSGCNNSTMAAVSGKPEDAVKTFVDDVNKGDGKGAMDCLLVENGDAAAATTFLAQSPMKLDASDYKVEFKEPYLASVSMTFHAEVKTMPQTSTTTDHVLVLYSGGKWRIVPAGMPTDTQLGLGSVASVLTMSNVFGQARKAAQRTAALSNAKQIALGVIMYSGDADDFYPMESNTTDAIMPYLKNKSLLTAPGDPDGTISYSFNERVLGKSATSIVNPATTVLLYQGKDHHLDFSHDGKAAVAFCDGHAKSITPDEESALNWDPTK